ncbi:MAG: site-2 protease family protein [Vicinamibacterales bacterium]
MDTSGKLLAFGIVLASLTFHEAAHAWVADRRGDPTARMLGRVSLNPLVHIDLFGTIILPLIALFSNIPILGWAKPVPVNTSRLGHPRRDFMLVAAAGPASNIVLAMSAAAAFHALGGFASAASAFGPVYWLRRAVEINLLLAVFNMVPIPPLDGGNVLAGLLPHSAATVFQGVRQYGFLILYALILSDVLWSLIGPPYLFLRTLLL